MASIAPSDPERPTAEPSPHRVDDAMLARLDQLERGVAEGNRLSRRTGNGFMIFAVFALVVALCTLLVVITKLDGNGTVNVNAPVTAGPTTGGGAAAPPAAPAARVGVSLKEYTVGLSDTVGRAGVVTFAVHNDGQMPHEFVVLRTAKPASGLLKGNEADETGNVGEVGDLQPGASKTLRLRLAAGHYALICNLPGHYKAGQHADFTVR